MLLATTSSLTVSGLLSAIHLKWEVSISRFRPCCAMDGCQAPFIKDWHFQLISGLWRAESHLDCA